MVASIDVIVGGQFGSEAKGHVTQQVIKRHVSGRPNNPVLNIRVAGPNAGHTVYADVRDNSFEQPVMEKFAFRQLPVGVVESADRVDCAIAAGSEIDLRVLLAEIQVVQQAGLWPEHQVMWVDPEATEINGHDLTEESYGGLLGKSMVDRIGSTGKGVGAARSGRIMRQPGRRIGDNSDAIKALAAKGVTVGPIDALYRTGNGAEDYHVVIEGTQGYGLGLHAGFYPQCTSSDCRAIDFLAMAGLSPWTVRAADLCIWVVVRPYPIRVAGNSGYLKGETSWEELGLPVEKTTVTQKVRRVGTWDSTLVQAAVKANGGGVRNSELLAAFGLPSVVLALTMADQIDPGVKGTTDPGVIYANAKVCRFVEKIQDETHAVVDLITTSPSTAVWL